jgi:hypothetical protein
LKTDLSQEEASKQNNSQNTGTTIPFGTIAMGVNTSNWGGGIISLVWQL